MIYSRSLLLALVLVMVLVLIRGKSRTHGQKENKTIKSPHQACLLPCLPLLMPVHTSSGPRSPFVSTGLPFAPASMDTGELYEFGYRHAPLPLSSLPMRSSGSVPPFRVISTPLGVGGPGQQRARPFLSYRIMDYFPFFPVLVLVEKGRERGL